MPAQLPQLPYSLQTRKKSIAIYWSTQLFTSSILILLLYFVLRYGAHTSTSITLAVPTATLGVFTLIGISTRLFALLRPSSTCQPLGGPRWACDFFTWSYISSVIIVTVVIATATAAPSIRQASLPQSIVLYCVGSQLLLVNILRLFKIRTPMRFSSTPADSELIPGTFVIIEDVVAVEGGGGQEFRRALRGRWDASPLFRALLWRLNWFWGIWALGTAVVTTLCIYLVDDVDVGFALGWTLPWVGGAIGTGITILWVQRVLRREAELGSEGHFGRV